MTARLRRMLLPAVLLGMQACWLYAWLSLIETKATGSSGVAPAAILFLIVAAITRTWTGRLPRRVLRLPCFWLLWVVLAATAGKLLLYPGMPWSEAAWLYALPAAAVRVIFETQPAELLLLLGSGVAWYLGGRVTADRPTHARFLADFQFGLVMLFAATLVAHGLEISPGHPVLLALAFFSLSLSGIALTRSRQEGTRATAPGNRQFAGSLVSLIGIVSFLGLLAGIAITPDLVGVLVAAGRFILYVILAILAFLISLLPDPDLSGGALPEPPAMSSDQAVLEFFSNLPLPAVVRRVMRMTVSAVFLGMMLVALWRICSAMLEWLRHRGNAAGVEVEKLDSGLLADLVAWLHWLARQPANLVHRTTVFFGRWIGTARVVTWATVYADMLLWAGRKLRPRVASESAHEYRAVL
ncbi:MAG: hypothetical protein M0R22_09715, partial [Dehalococcoidia bacterium]|nr:hypothetical protein [Dehalococcoidia bacterium]